ncbi:glutamyl-tRNA(Gln) amidotransferase subunit A, mitochondrial [Condylostylus longicornis]|uniref:glutamyl-tRNA(Gln) amidotransferase subunit A, mitochondrial n=1 Tax=Condylostylus longicornis TaxID=2530218 RepID=UPI00244DE55B|nr:glutamyl-tRNA(Gln) amidotransferase subunit A, mitochondrial [Condylostylus longicornis]
MKRHIQSNIKQLVGAYKDGIINPQNVIDYSLDDAAKLKILNAFVRLCPEAAFHQAKESTFRYQNKQEKSYLDGVPIAVKDNFCTKDIHTTCASKMLQDFIPPYNATVCEKLFNSGAILVGKTNLDQFGMGSGTVDSIFGPTKNIWSEDLTSNMWRIAGGSSGGSATAVAAGIVFGALGSDTGGSTRNPASYCGVIGYKPSYGLLSRHGLIPLVNSMDVPGIITRTVNDCSLILNAVAGPCKYDSTTVKKEFNPFILEDEISVSGIKIGIPEEYNCEGLSEDVKETWIKIADLLENEGAIVKKVSLPHTEASIFVYSILNQCEVSSNMARYDGIEYGHRAEDESSTEQLYAKSRAEGFNTVVKTRILAGNYFLLRRNYEKYFLKALKVRRLIADDFKKVFNNENGVDVLLTPTTLSDAPLYTDFIKSSNRDQCAVQDYCTQPANMSGIPAINVPIRLSSRGLPIGLQLMSDNFNDQFLLTIAKWIESQVNFDCLENNQIYAART